MVLEFVSRASVVEAGEVGQPLALVLHGGGGPRTVAPLVGHLGKGRRVLASTHPGWEGTALPESLTSVAQLAADYLELLAEEPRDGGVTVVGSSIGGWIALEMAVQAAKDARFERLIGSVIVIDSVGVEVAGEPIADFFSLSPRQLAELAWHDADRGYLDPAGFSVEQRAVLAGNAHAMKAIAGSGMADPTLLGRLSAVSVPTLVVWGASDRVVTPSYGRALATAVPGAEFAEVEQAGHLPHLEQPAATFAVIERFLGATR
ncbi:alpha/beta fold hydrolase [Herbiconiux flava]|uniref:Pimeloyl-ACP methyl ester carboxylesterase n=1 Tax=Herbiconiux flava TaxID=881268 RepID=A0A852SQB1_9MICO|nr:alpha/beta fold hydrolase [Herbiconiux flava]NYD70982.1 pimeloyl-ACP methyl ester carboxylesterase [Herbiconiux flava]GLK19054.1 alpha/beta hydrolase [Herbiconiux flava]